MQQRAHAVLRELVTVRGVNLLAQAERSPRHSFVIVVVAKRPRDDYVALGLDHYVNALRVQVVDALLPPIQYVEVGAQQTVDVGQQVQVKRIQDAQLVVVRGVQQRHVFYHVEAEQQAGSAVIQQRAHLADKSQRLRRRETADGRAGIEEQPLVRAHGQR